MLVTHQDVVGVLEFLGRDRDQDPGISLLEGIHRILRDPRRGCIGVITIEREDVIPSP